jgi:hypothetical protein
MSSHRGSWYVGFYDAHYSDPLTKSEALSRARAVLCSGASKPRSVMISVFGDDGELIETTT